MNNVSAVSSLFVHGDVLAVRAAELRVLELVNIALSLAFMSPELVANTATIITLIAYTSYGNDLSPKQVSGLFNATPEPVRIKVILFLFFASTVCILQPVDRIITSFVQGLQSASKHCEWTHVDYVIHGLPLATRTEV